MVHRDPSRTLVTLALGFSSAEFDLIITELEPHHADLDLRRPAEAEDLISALAGTELDTILIREQPGSRQLPATLRYIRTAAPSVGVTVIADAATDASSILEAGAHEVLADGASVNDIRIAVRRSASRASAIVKTTPTSSLAVFDRLPVATFRTLMSGEFIQANQAMGRLLGYKSGTELIGQDVRKFYIDREVRRDLLDRIGESDEMIRTETQFIRDDGRIIWVAIMNYLVRDAFERPLYIEGIVLDITELRQERRRSAAAEIGYKRLFDDSPVALWELDCSRTADRLYHEVVTVGHDAVVGLLERDEALIDELIGTIQVRQVNQAALRMCRPSADAEFEREWLDHCLRANNRELAKAQFLAILRGRREIESRLSLEVEDGEIHARVYWGVTKADGDRPYQRVIVAFTDETAEIEHRSELQRSIESKERFIASVSHHLRTPMTAVLGFAQEIVDGITEFDQSEMKEMLGEIARAAKLAAAIVEDMAVASLAEDETLLVSLGPVEAAGIVRGIIEDLWLTNTHVTLALTDAICLADRGRLRQVVRGMVSNAIEHGGGEVDISVTERGGKVHIAVIDDGPGLNGTDPQEIFAPHFATRVRSSSPGPIGLGLHVARELARAMGGDLTYERPNGHTVFRLALPRYEDVSAIGEDDPSHP